MIADFPTPVLSVAPEGVRELDGREALSKLWTLFTKCKESIENGRRLENISWRLWYRDMLTLPICHSPNSAPPTLEKFLIQDQLLDEKIYRPPTPLGALAAPHPDQVASGKPSAESDGTVATTTLSASLSAPFRHQSHADTVRKPLRPLPVGQIICDMLPNSCSSGQSPPVSSHFISLSLSPSQGPTTRIPRPESLGSTASLGRSTPGDNKLPLLGSAFLPLLPIPSISGLPPAPVPLVASSQLPTPGTERDESAQFGKFLDQTHRTPPTILGKLSTLPAHNATLSQLQASPVTAPTGAPTSTTQVLTVTCPPTGPPSPSLSDSYARAHPNEVLDADYRQAQGLPGVEVSSHAPLVVQSSTESAGDRHYNPAPDTPFQPSIVPAIEEGVSTHATIATPPRLVVVNPTPGPTPHPTPPATPLSFLASGDGSKTRAHGQFLAPPSTRAGLSQTKTVPAPNVTAAGTVSSTGPIPNHLRDGPDPVDPSTPSGLSNVRILSAGSGYHQSKGQSTPPNQDSPAQERLEGIPRQNPSSAAQNPNRLSTSSTTSTSSTAVTTTTSDGSSESQLSVGATSVHSDGSSSADQTKNDSSSEALKSSTPMGPPSTTIRTSKIVASPTDMASPMSPTVPSTSVNSVKSNNSTASAGTRSRNGAPGLTRRASSGAGSTSGARKGRKLGGQGTGSSVANRATSSDASRSRSRDASGSRKGVAAAAGALAATMGMTTAVQPAGGVAGGAGKKRMGGGIKAGGKRVALARTASRGSGFGGGAALARTLSHEEVEEVSDEEEEENEEAQPGPTKEQLMAAARLEKEKEVAAARLEKEKEAAAALAAKEAAAALKGKQREDAGHSRAKFKFGSNSDNGSQAGTEISSRHPGSLVHALPSGFETMGTQGRVDAKGKGREVAAPQPTVANRNTQAAREADPALLMQQLAAEGERQAREEQRQREVEADTAAALARAHESLAEPLLPQGGKRTILLTSDSEDSDSDGDDSWTSEDVDEGVVVENHPRQQPPGPRQSSQASDTRQQQQLVQAYQQPQDPPQRPTGGVGLQRTHSNTSGRHSRREWQHIQQRREAQLRVQRAAALLQREEEEKQRQREMFAKKPTSSFQNLTEINRTQSFGYLTKLMHPDPSIFPVNHPYRRGHSSGEIPAMGFTMTAMTPGPQVQGQGRAQITNEDPRVAARPQQPRAQPAPPPPPPQQKPQGPLPPRFPRRAATEDDSKLVMPPPTTTKTDPSAPSTQPPSPVRSEKRQSTTSAAMALALRGIRSLGLGPTAKKSEAVGPLATQVAVGSVQTKGAAAPPSLAPDLQQKQQQKGVGSAGSSGGYRPKGPLPGQEMDTDSEDEADNSVPGLSKSLAQDRLRQFAARRGIVPGGGQQMPAHTEEEEIPVWAREPERGAAAAGHQADTTGAAAGVVQPAAPAPIMMHPYNLPVNAVPSTPRTVRRQMLKNEMPESLRRQLLWERKQAGVPIRRTSSTGGVNGPVRNNLLTGLRPLTTNPAPSMVQLQPKGTARQQQHQEQAAAGPSQEPGVRGSGDRERRASSGRADVEQQQQRAEQFQSAMARNRSWADTYHAAGW